jgi:uncharacterized protein YbbK (DUF523 family)
MTIKVLVSACLLGERCRYDGASKPNDAAIAMLGDPNIEVIPVCPEVLGGLDTPRDPSEITHVGAYWRVQTQDGRDVSQAFIDGAEAVLDIAKKNDIRLACLKSNSPSCSSRKVYDGTFSGTLRTGYGVSAKTLVDAGVNVIDESEITYYFPQLAQACERAAGISREVGAQDACKLQGDACAKCGVCEADADAAVSARGRYIPQKPRPTLGKAVAHFKTITRHKIEVAKLLCRLGLYKQAAAHDLSKYTPVEFLAGARYYQGTRSPNTAEREQCGFCEAWLHHKGRNRHHFEYWEDIRGRGDGRIVGAPMPVRYVVEMFCDRVAACKIYQGDAYTDASALEYYELNRDKYIMHPATAALLECLLHTLVDYGEDATFEAIRAELL